MESIPESGIYTIQSISHPDLLYVGRSENLAHRQETHLYKLGRHKHHTVRLQQHFDQYGAEDLAFKVIRYCPKEELIEAEQYYMDLLNPQFNTQLVACKSKPRQKITTEIRQKVREQARDVRGERVLHPVTSEQEYIGNDRQRFYLNGCFYYSNCA
jgi:group I intron endonuclease